MEIEILPKNVAVLTRGRIYSDTDVIGLWKTKEIELFAKAAYEWKCGSRKKAYQSALKASYSMIFNEDIDEYVMNQRIRKYTDEDTWKDYVIDVLIGMPDIEIEIGEWVKIFSAIFKTICTKYAYEISTDKNLKDTFKIKRSDKNTPNFKQIPLRKYFEKKTEYQYTRSSIHGVKGETYDAVLIYVKGNAGSTITPKLLMEGSLDQELMHLAYVAMTRPRRLLMLAMPETKRIDSCGRFPEELWNYEVL